MKEELRRLDPMSSFWPKGDFTPGYTKLNFAQPKDECSQDLVAGKGYD